MEVSKTVNLFVTYVEKEGPFLKLWGQTDKNNSIYVEQVLLGASDQFDLGVGILSPDSLQVGALVAAKFKDNKYYRAKITNVFLHEGFVEVCFLDYGNKDVVPSANIRSLQSFPGTFISLPALAIGFIFAEAHCPGGGEWNDAVFDSISKEIKYREFQCSLLIQATQYYLVKLFVGGTDLCSLLISRGLMQPISLQAQQAVLLSMSMRPNIPQQAASTASTSINTFKACVLEPGSQYPVYVSYVNDGPCHFSVQLEQSENILARLMNDINTIPVRLLEEVPIPGTICLAHCQEDGNICRAVVTNEVDNQFKVFYVDFGNYEIVPLEALYQIPFKFVLPKVMAIRFALAGVEKSTVTIEMQCAFKKFVDNRLLHMKVLPAPTRMAIPKCELWDPETKTSALDVLNRAAQNAYPDPVSLNRGVSQLIKVSFVYSCNRFYVQLVSRDTELTKLMQDLQITCHSNDFMDPSALKQGLPCCALYEADQQWYRSRIVEVLGENVRVRYIDYGNEEILPSLQLKIIDGEQLTVLRPQAIECCLNGYQNMEEDLERDGFLEELILEGQFTMKVVEMLGKKALVELFDSSNYNVASLLLDKLAAAKSQVSPMLVQAGNKIEHRKSFSYQNGPREQNFRQDRKPGRESKNWTDKPNDRNEKSWRQDNTDFRKHDKNSNENSNDGNSWRQNNKGFSPRNDKFDGNNMNRSNDWNNKENFSNASNNNWESNTNDKPYSSGNDDWTTPPNNAGYKSKDNDFSRNKGRFDHDKPKWNAEGSRSGGGYRTKPDFKKDGSESSGSEKSFHKGPRTSSRNDRGGKYSQNFDKPKNTSFNSNSTVADNSWNVSAVTPLDAAPATATFIPYDVVGIETEVIISWFHNPSHFYCQLSDKQDEFRALMTEIQQFYKGYKPELAVVGAPVIGLFPEDNVLYRAQVLEVIGTRYKVYYVDFGNVSTIDKVWPIEKKYMTLPAQAIVCSLCGIAPPGDDWPDSDNYSKHFEKEVFTCQFINKDEAKCYVNLFYGSDDIRQLLVQDGLAISTQQSIPNIEIPLLIGQTFRAVIKSVNNLSDIILALECGVAISCQMHNLESATETFESYLKGLLEQTVIVYVDNVLDDSLEVTLYDIEGNKHTILNPDEGAFETVEALCPPLILNSTLTGWVSHVDESSVFIQPSEYSETVAYILDQMFEFYEKQKQDLPIIPEEGLLYAVHSQDTNWYRARVISFDDEKALVQYVDYGNSEEVAFSELRELLDSFLETCTLCVQVFTNVPTDLLAEKEVIAVVKNGENGWNGVVELNLSGESSATESAQADAVEQIVSTESHDVEFLVKDSKSEVLPGETNDVILENEDEVQQDENFIPQRGTQVLVSHIDNPNQFYLQFAESINAIEELQSNLQEQVKEMPILENPTAGILCAAPYSGDQQWYRAEVLDADDDITTVRFVDYGNTDVIDNKTTQIKTLPSVLLSLAEYASRSSLKVMPNGCVEWNSPAIDRFQGLTENVDVITAEFTDQNEKTNYVELYVDGLSVKDVLIEEKLAVPVEFTSESKSTCFVSHLNSPSEFWIQLENCIAELEWVASQLEDVAEYKELEDLAPGTLCAALFPDDEMWYRARILSNTVAGIELLFIDYGNSCMSNSLKELPEQLVVIPPLAQKCSLQKPEGIPYWSTQAVDHFKEIAADGQTIFSVRKISTDETSVVQLLVEGEDVVAILMPVTENCYVKDVESLDNFTIEINEETIHKKCNLEVMPGTTWDNESSEKFKKLAEPTEQGSPLFQVEFVSEVTVRLYLNGNDIRTSLGAVKRTSLNLPIENKDDKAEDSNKTDENIYLDKMLQNKEIPEDILTEHEGLNKITDTIEESPYKTGNNNVYREITSVPDEGYLDGDGHIYLRDEIIANTTPSIEKNSNKIKEIENNEGTEELYQENEVDNINEDTIDVIGETNYVKNNLAPEEKDMEQHPNEIKDVGVEISSSRKFENDKENAVKENEVDKENKNANGDHHQKRNKQTKDENRIQTTYTAEGNNLQNENTDEGISNTENKPDDEEKESDPRKISAKDSYNESNRQTTLHNYGINKETTEVLTKDDTDTMNHLIEVHSEPPDLSRESLLKAEEQAFEVISDNSLQISIPNKDTLQDNNKTEEAEEKLIGDSNVIENTQNRPSSSGSGKISHDDRILPAVISRPQTPLEKETFESEHNYEYDGLSSSEVNELLKELVDKTVDKDEEQGVNSRPHSSGSEKISHDDRIVPAVLSRPQSPLPLSDEN